MFYRSLSGYLHPMSLTLLVALQMGCSKSGAAPSTQDSSVDTDLSAGSDAAADTDADSALDSDWVADSESDADTDTDTDTDTDADADPDIDTGAASDTDAADTEVDTGADSDTDSDTNSDSGFNVDISLSPLIGTVGIVEWSVGASIDSAYIDFNREEGKYEFRAPVDLDEPGYRTLLLGMKPLTTYYLQIIAEGSGSTYKSDVYAVTTEPVRNGMPSITVNDQNGGEIYEGFTVACKSGMSGGGGGGSNISWAYIFDKDGEYVWWYQLAGSNAACSRANMSYDGKYMYTGNINVGSNTGGALMRVAMDGTEEKNYDLPARHHDFAILPNNHIAYIALEEGGDDGMGGESEGCDIIKELDPESGSSTDIYAIRDDFNALADRNGCHTNAINFIPHLDALSLSILNFDTIAVVSYPDGLLLTTYGGPQSDYDMSWDRQHQHQVLEKSILIFNNNGTSGGGSSALEYDIDGTSAELVSDYSSGKSSMTFGDVKRLPNGNTLVTYSNSGIIHELDTSGTLVREITTDGLGYTVRRSTLYGPPPPYAE